MIYLQFLRNLKILFNKGKKNLINNFIFQKNQIELDQKIHEDGSIDKKVKISTLCKVEWYENDGATKLVPVTGVAILKKGRGNAVVSRVVNVAIGIKQLRKGYELKPGIESSSRRITVNGGDIKDIPCQYCIVGLEKYELPVIGKFHLKVVILFLN